MDDFLRNKAIWDKSQELIDRYREDCIKLQKRELELLNENYALKAHLERAAEDRILYSGRLHRCKGIHCHRWALRNSLFCRHHQSQTAELQTLEQILQEQTGESE